MLKKQQIEQAVKVSNCLKAMAHEVRLMILVALGNKELGVNDIAAMLDVPQPTISQHLSKMREGGVVVARRDGNQIFYSIADPRIFEFLDLLKKIFCSK